MLKPISKYDPLILHSKPKRTILNLVKKIQRFKQSRTKPNQTKTLALVLDENFRGKMDRHHEELQRKTVSDCTRWLFFLLSTTGADLCDDMLRNTGGRLCPAVSGTANTGFQINVGKDN